MLGALTLQGMQPGPLMFTDHGDMVYTLFVGMIFCYFMLLVLGLLSLKVIGNVVKIPGNILTPMILALCVVGTYALNNSLFDVGIMLIAGVVGYFMQKGGYPASPVVLALIMGQWRKVIFAVRCRFLVGHSTFCIPDRSLWHC